MRFSDMMGSGSEPPEPPEPSDADADGVIANALAPYLDADAGTRASAAPANAEPVTDVGHISSPEPAPAAPVAPAVRSWVPDRPVPGSEPPVPVVAAASPIIEFTPLSDDLLPHRR